MSQTPPRSDESQSTRKRPWGRIAGGLCLVGVAGLSIWAERDAHASLREGRAKPEHVMLTLHGLELDQVSTTVRGMPVRAEHVTIRPTWDGVLVEIDGLSGGRVAARSDETNDGGSGHSGPDRSAFDSIPVEIETTGTLTLFDNELGRVEVQDPRARRDAAGGWTGSATLAVDVAGQTAHAELEATRDEGDIVVSGTGSFDAGDAVGIAGRLEDDAWRLEVADQNGGSTLVELMQPTQESPTMVARATGFDLGTVAPLVAALPMPRTTDDVDLSHAVLSGTLRVEPRDSGTWASLQDVTIEGLSAKVAALSPHRLHFQPLSIAGDLTRTPEGSDAPAGMGGWLSIEHGGTQLELAGARSGSLVSLSAQVPTRDCQGLFESMPAGLLPVLEGMELSGEVAGELSLSFDEHDLTTELPVPELVDEPEWPGELSVSFPVLEDCAVVREPTAVDLEALAGPYRHRFVGDDGSAHERILATGDPEYVTTRAVPELVAAFVVMEDTRFFRHDGFEREQIERALWFNLGAGRFARGASTISQQTARNLWLGMDRSLGRKLQEAVLTSMLERGLPKRRILELYLNIIELGPNVYGVAQASRYHFGKPASALNQLEAAYLASLAPAPVSLSRRFSEGGVDAQWREHLLYQVKRMDFHNMITGDAAIEARKTRLKLVPHDRD